MNSLSEANTKFMFDLFQQFRKSKKNNIFYSPISITSALGMVLLGAKDNTAQQIKKVLHFDQVTENTTEKAATYHEYLDAIKKFYQTSVESADFANASEESRKKINSWVESQTNEKIKNLFPDGTIGNDTTLVLVNAIYFKGQWENKFKKENTKEEKFWPNKNTYKSVQMMRQYNSFNFALLEDVQAKVLEIPYKGKDLSMIVLLPNEIDGL
ncbi:SERPINB4 isoform 3, partial [Pan troglodytes]